MGYEVIMALRMYHMQGHLIDQFIMPLAYNYELVQQGHIVMVQLLS